MLRLRAFLAVDLVDAVVAAGAEPHAVEHEELGLRAEERGVADARRLQIGLGLLRRGARVAVVRLAGGRLDDVAEQDQARLGGERIHHRGVGVRHQDHVGLVDRLPAGDRGAVEHDAVAEHLLLDGGDVLRGVLPLAARIGEPQVHVFHGMLGEHLQHLANAAVRACRPSSHVWFPRPVSIGAPAIPSEAGANCMGPHHATPSRSGPSTRFRHGPEAGFVALSCRARPRPRRVRRCGCGSHPRPRRRRSCRRRCGRCGRS